MERAQPRAVEPASPCRPTRERRIAVLGTTGSGKSMLAAQLARRLNVPHVELDSIMHGPNWAETPEDLFRARTAEALSGDGWVADGNYAAVRDLTIGQADTIVWLDYPIIVSLWRVTRRTLWRIVRREELWNGNRETWRNTFFSRDALIPWVLKTHRPRRREFIALFQQPQYAGRRVVRLRSPRAANRWLACIAPPSMGQE
jgi:adenylate kinase family enzyme